MRFVYPKNLNYVICNHRINGTHKIDHEEPNDCIDLRMLHRKGSLLEKVFQFKIEGMKNGFLKFSKNGEHLLIFDHLNSKVTIYKFDSENYENL